MEKKKCISASNYNFNLTSSKNKAIISKFIFLLSQKSIPTGSQGYHTALYSNTQLFQSTFKIKWSNMGRKVQ